jgi:hypothetical protein
MNLLYRGSKIINEMAKMGLIITVVSLLFYKMSSYI